MAAYPYSPNPATLKKFLEHVESAGVPQKVTLQYLSSVGFKSTNDRPILRVFKALGWIDGSGAPTDVWRRYRNKATARAVLAESLKSAYPALFATYPDAHRKDTEALRNFFSTHADQWAIAGLKALPEPLIGQALFARNYFKQNANGPCFNKYEIRAGLEDGGYEQCLVQ